MGKVVRDFHINFPVGPILPFLARQQLAGMLEKNARGAGGVALARWLSASTGELYETEHRILARIKSGQTTICCHVADRWSFAFGYHPGSIWGWDVYESLMARVTPGARMTA